MFGYTKDPVCKRRVRKSATFLRVIYQVLNLAVVYRQAGRYTIALQYATALERQGAQNPYLLVLLSDLFLQKRDYDRAITYGQKAVALDPTLTQTYYLMGVAYTKKGLTRQAEETFTKGRDLNGSGGVSSAPSLRIADIMEQFWGDKLWK